MRSNELDDGLWSTFDEELEALRDVVGDRDFNSILAFSFRRAVNISLRHEPQRRQSAHLGWVETLSVSSAQTVRQLDRQYLLAKVVAREI